MRNQGWLNRPQTETLVFALVYYALATVSLRFVAPEHSLTALWPCSGYWLGVLVSRPRDRWAGLAGSVWIADLLAKIPTSLSVLGTVLSATYVIEGLAAALVLQTLTPDGRWLDSAVRFVRFALVVALVSNPLSASLATLAQLLSHGSAGIGTFWQMRWLSSTLGSLAAAPLTIALLQGEWRRIRPDWRTVEFPMLIVATSVAGVFVKDLQGHYLLANGVFAQQLNRKVEDVLCRTDAQLFPPERHLVLADYDRRILQTGAALQAEEEHDGDRQHRTLLAVRFPVRDREVDWQCDALPKVRGDPMLIGLVWTNLLSNALKYARPRNNAIVRVMTRIDPDADGQITFIVQDNGVGFDMKYVSKLFGVFQRLHSTHDFEGTGIGLANVQRIVRRHGGRTWAEGAVNQGATFFFSLPTLA